MSHQFTNLKFGKRIHVLPFSDSIESQNDNLFDEYLKPYFLDAYRPLKKGNCFSVQGPSKSVEFKVIEIDDACLLCLNIDTSLIAIDFFILLFLLVTIICKG